MNIAEIGLHNGIIDAAIEKSYSTIATVYSVELAQRSMDARLVAIKKDEFIANIAGLTEEIARLQALKIPVIAIKRREIGIVGLSAEELKKLEKKNELV